MRVFSGSGRSQNYGATNRISSTTLYGSSIAYSGIDWKKVSEVLSDPIESWASLGSTPSEWEQLPQPANRVSRVFIAVSLDDLNEYILSDYRADYVPLKQTLRDLWQLKADWQFCKRVLSQYPIRALRNFFPTVGRSDGVMTGIRDQLKRLIPRGSHRESGEAFRLKIEGDSGLEERLSDWSPARLERRTVLEWSARQGKHSFDGLKKMAMIRLLQKVHRQSEVTWLALPMSPYYQKEFLTATIRQNFEMELIDFQRLRPQAKLIRLDKLPLLRDDAMFADFYHLNRYGQQIATVALINQLEDPEGKRP
jgi:hypothetical protein